MEQDERKHERRKRFSHKLHAFGAGLCFIVAADYCTEHSWLAAAYFGGCFITNLVCAWEGM
jgi:hypothetical protein